MASNNPQEEILTVEFPNLIRIYGNGRIERLRDTDFVPPSTDLETAVVSKDITFLNETYAVPARLYLPKQAADHPNRKLPLVVYFHGGGFLVNSPFTAKSHGYVNAVVSESNVAALSVGYSKAPEHDATAAYADANAALSWIGSHRNGNGSEPWINRHVDFNRIFLLGDSAGANVAHNAAIFAGYIGIHGVDLLGIALIHPYFWGSEPIGSESAADPGRKSKLDSLWPFVCPSNPDNDDPRVNPVAADAPDLAGLGCRRLLVCVAEKDLLRDRGRMYYEAVSRSRWFGTAEIMETEEEDHVFHLWDLNSEKAKGLIRKLAAFFNRDNPQHLL